MSVVLVFLFSFFFSCCFYLGRCILALWWNETLGNIALEESGVSTWYHDWDITDAIFNPKNLLIITPEQWYKKLKGDVNGHGD